MKKAAHFLAEMSLSEMSTAFQSALKILTSEHFECLTVLEVVYYFPNTISKINFEPIKPMASNMKPTMVKRRAF